MSTIYVLNGGGSGVWLEGTGAGTASDPFRPYHAPVGISGVPTVQGTVAISNTAIGVSGEPTVSLAPRAGNGLSGHLLISTATTNAATVKGSSGQLYGYYLYNRGGAETHVKLYNKATAPTVGTDVPTNLITMQPSGGANMSFPFGVEFSTGLGLAVTKGVLHTDTTAVASGDVVGMLWYK